MTRPGYVRIAVLVVLGVVLYFVFRILEAFLPALIWAAILATVFRPLYSALLRRLRHPHAASALTCAFLTIVIVLPALFLLLTLAKQSVVAYKALETHLTSGGPASLDALRNAPAYQWFLAKCQSMGLPEPDMGAAATKGISILSEFLVSRSTQFFSSITHSVINFFVMIFALYYLLLQGPSMLRQLRALSFLRPEHEDQIIEKFRAIVRATFGGSLATALIHGVADGIIFLIFGLPSPLLWGTVMALLSLIPLIGSGLVWIPLVVYYLLKGSVLRAVLLVVACGGVSAVVEYAVKPQLIKRGMEIDSFWVLLSILGGIGVFGFLGLFLGPFLIALLLVLIEAYKAEFRDELGEIATPM